MSEWRPIETAPRDGTVILACAKGHPDCSLVSWDARRARWVGICDGWRVIESEGDWGTDYLFPFVTHWQPLPPPPKE